MGEGGAHLLRYIGTGEVELHEVMGKHLQFLCNDGKNNDTDIYNDCDDNGCWPCGICGGEGCSLGCDTYEIVLTEPAKEALADYPLLISCPPYWDLGLDG